MSKNEMVTESNISSKEMQKGPETIINFLLKKRDLHWEIYKSIENKAVQLVLFSGVMIGLLINIIGSFPSLNERIAIPALGINYSFLGLTLFFYILAAFSGLIVISNSFFLHTSSYKTKSDDEIEIFSDKGFLNDEAEITLSKCFNNSNKEDINEEIFHCILNEIEEELSLIRQKHKDSSRLLRVGFTFYSLGIAIIFITLTITNI